MEYIWAPWRIEYILGEKEKDCIFCVKPKQDSDKEKIDSLVAEINVIHAEKLNLKVNSILAIKEILTPEQYQKLQEQIEMRKEIMREMHGKHGGRCKKEQEKQEDEAQ